MGLKTNLKPVTETVKPMNVSSGLWAMASMRNAKVINEKERRVRATIITVGPGNNVQKVFYTPEAIKSAQTIFDGAPIGIDHPDEIEKQIRSEGSIKDLCGYIDQGTLSVEGDALVGDIIINPGSSFDWVWDNIKLAVEYAQKFPGKNYMGLSINAMTGPGKPIRLGDETWTSVDAFTSVNRIDIVTKPARGGKFDEVVSESNREEVLIPGDSQDTISANIAHLIRKGYDKEQASAIALKKARGESETGNDAKKIYQTLFDRVRELEKQNAPMAQELRRELDQLGTALNFMDRKEGETMFPTEKPVEPGKPGVTPGAPEKPTDDKSRYGQMAEAHRLAAESESDPQKKAMLSEAADHFKKLAEGELTISHSSAAESEGEAESNKASESEEESEGEAKKTDEAKKASESERKYLKLFTENLLEKSGLSEAGKGYMRLTLESARDESHIKKSIEAFAKMQVEESNRGAHGASTVTESTRTSGVDLKSHLLDRGIRY